MDEHFKPPPILDEALPVKLIDGEVAIGGPPGASMTPAAARETGKRLIEAADEAERA